MLFPLRQIDASQLEKFHATFGLALPDLPGLLIVLVLLAAVYLALYWHDWMPGLHGPQ